MSRWIGGVFLLALVALLEPASAADRQAIARGRAFVGAYCARCHAVGRTGSSTNKSAPPFRTLGQRYPIASIAEALAEGIVVGHSEMPEFILSPADIGAVIAYIESVQDRR